ncbi:Las1-domain-containing protein [Epithele typhae]|uniref:Las1-domain-containing protein n=1 Tax=Epithele typhae TaxID=378194 RepID=UPI002007F35B|nr:Las1-domain-containing protein [Epithele typhae]KAH9927532.1 Las1-domain-containing protein [Epithele typhae]
MSVVVGTNDVKPDFDLPAFLARHPPARALEIARAVIAGLKGGGVVRFACTGYCYGGRTAFDLAIANDVSVVAASHPSLLKCPDDILSLSELEQVCSWIYTDESDRDATQRAVDRVLPLPHALESAHALLCAILQDGTAAPSSSYLSLRMSYASAIIRLVNGLVDPLQLGAYARSIHSIAQQLGLPAWLVELRHAATHEDLPSLELLRDAAREAMAWLLHNYFLPTLNPAPPSSAPSAPLRPVGPLLKQYKTLLKSVTRDATLHAQLRAPIEQATRAVERWLAEAKLAAPSASSAWDDGEDDGDGDAEDARERWALERLADALVEKGTLVPLSKQKRIRGAQLAPPPASVAIWAPLLVRLQSCTRRSRSAWPPPSPPICADTVALADEPDSERPRADPSYDLCLAGWAKWLADTGAGAAGAEVREAIVVRLVSALGPGQTGGSKASAALLHALSAERPRLAAALSVLAQDGGAAPTAVDVDDGSALAEMDARLNALLGIHNETTTPDADTDAVPASASAEAGADAASRTLPAGWRRLSERDGWRPAPIGVFVSC